MPSEKSVEYQAAATRELEHDTLNPPNAPVQQVVQATEPSPEVEPKMEGKVQSQVHGESEKTAESIVLQLRPLCLLDLRM